MNDAMQLIGGMNVHKEDESNVISIEEKLCCSFVGLYFYGSL